MTRMVEGVIAAAAITILLLTGTIVVDSLTTTTDGIRIDESDTVLLDSMDEWVTIDSVAGYNETVLDSRGNAVSLSGSSDSYVQSTDNITVSQDNNFTVSVWGRAASGAGASEMTLLDVSGEVLIVYNGSRSDWVAWYYDVDSRNSYLINVSAPNQPSNLTNVQVVANDTHLAIYRNNTLGETANLSVENIADAPTSAGSWNGEIDEIRAFSTNLTSSERQQLINNDGVAPGPTGTNRSLRVMFDEDGKTTQLAFYFSGAFTLNNADIVSSGLPGHTQTEGTDYDWDTNGPRIRPLSGGGLDDAPVAYVDYERESGISNAVDAWLGASALGALIPLVIIVGVILFVVSRIE